MSACMRISMRIQRVRGGGRSRIGARERERERERERDRERLKSNEGKK
jgi:hypothetical protein